MKTPYSTFANQEGDVLSQPMFCGNSVNVSRFDRPKLPIFDKLTEKQLSFFWRPEEVDVTKDKIDFAKLLPNERHIFISNLQYQILLDSIQGRSPSIAFLPLVSLPELETWIETWAFSETIHSRSYTHIIRAIINEPSAVFDDIIKTDMIIKRASGVSSQYDRLIAMTQSYFVNKDVSLRELKRQLYLTMVSVNILEAIRFYVSFACSFAFAERKIMEGNAKIIKLIARDEALHLSGTQHILLQMRQGKSDPEMQEIAEQCENEVVSMFEEAYLQEKDWAHYLFANGSMIGLSAEILVQYLEYITGVRMNALNLKPIFTRKSNPLPWIDHWINSEMVQVAPQETEITSYLISAFENDTNNLDNELDGFKL